MSQQGQLCLGQASSLTPPSGGGVLPRGRGSNAAGLGVKGLGGPRGTGVPFRLWLCPAGSWSCSQETVLGTLITEFSPRAPHSQDPWGLL